MFPASWIPPLHPPERHHDRQEGACPSGSMWGQRMNIEMAIHADGQAEGRKPEVLLCQARSRLPLDPSLVGTIPEKDPSVREGHGFSSQSQPSTPHSRGRGKAQE